MKRTSYEPVSARTFRHPLVKKLGDPWVAHTAPLGVRVYDKTAYFFYESVVRGDTCEHSFDLRVLLEPHAPIDVWSVSTAVSREYGRNLCTVYGPEGLDVETYGTDIALLYMLQVMGEFAKCREVVGKWGELARNLAGIASWTQAAGWIHRDAGVVVVCQKMENAPTLSHELSMLFGRGGIPCGVVGHIDVGDQVAIWKKAANILRRHIAR